MSLAVKYKRYTLAVQSTLLFGCEVWRWNKQVMQRIQGWESRTLLMVSNKRKRPPGCMVRFLPQRNPGGQGPIRDGGIHSGERRRHPAMVEETPGDRTAPRSSGRAARLEEADADGPHARGPAVAWNAPDTWMRRRTTCAILERQFFSKPRCLPRSSSELALWPSCAILSSAPCPCAMPCSR